MDHHVLENMEIVYVTVDEPGGESTDQDPFSNVEEPQEDAQDSLMIKEEPSLEEDDPPNVASFLSSDHFLLAKTEPVDHEHEENMDLENESEYKNSDEIVYENAKVKVEGVKKSKNRGPTRKEQNELKKELMNLSNEIKRELNAKDQLPYRCSKCSKMFKSKDSEGYHTSKVCLDGVFEMVDDFLPYFKCMNCEKTFKSEDGQRYHAQNVCTDATFERTDQLENNNYKPIGFDIENNPVLYRCMGCQKLKLPKQIAAHTRRICPNATPEKVRIISGIELSNSNEEKSIVNITRQVIQLSPKHQLLLRGKHVIKDEPVDEADTSSDTKSIKQQCINCYKIFKDTRNEGYHTSKVCPGSTFEKVVPIDIVEIMTSDDENSYFNHTTQTLYITSNDQPALVEESINREPNDDNLIKHPAIKKEPTEDNEASLMDNPFLYRCTKCSKQFKTEEGSKYHAKNVCIGASFDKTDEAYKYKCKICDYLCEKRRQLKYHLQSHKNNGHLESGNLTFDPDKHPVLYKCNQCNKLKLKQNKKYHSTKSCPGAILEKIRLILGLESSNFEDDNTYLNLTKQSIHLTQKDKTLLYKDERLMSDIEQNDLTGGDESNNDEPSNDHETDSQIPKYKQFLYRCTSCDKLFKSKDYETYHTQKSVRCGAGGAFEKLIKISIIKTEESSDDKIYYNHNRKILYLPTQDANQIIDEMDEKADTNSVPRYIYKCNKCCKKFKNCKAKRYHQKTYCPDGVFEKIAKSPMKIPGKKVEDTGYRRRLVKCRTCEACMQEDCMNCAACKAMPKYGGNGNVKQGCYNKKCINPRIIEFNIHNKNWACKRCPYVGTIRDDLRRHIRSEHKGKFSNYTDEHMEIKQEVDLGLVKTEAPDEDMDSGNESMNSMGDERENVKTGMIRLECKECEFVPKDKEELYRHRKSKHRNSSPALCPHCNTYFTRRDNLTTHMKLRCKGSGSNTEGENDNQSNVIDNIKQENVEMDNGSYPDPINMVEANYQTEERNKLDVERIRQEEKRRLEEKRKLDQRINEIQRQLQQETRPFQSKQMASRGGIGNYNRNPGNNIAPPRRFERGYGVPPRRFEGSNVPPHRRFQGSNVAPFRRIEGRNAVPFRRIEGSNGVPFRRIEGNNAVPFRRIGGNIPQPSRFNRIIQENSRRFHNYYRREETNRPERPMPINMIKKQPNPNEAVLQAKFRNMIKIEAL